MKNAGIQTGIHYKPNHLLTLYGGGRLQLPVTEQMYREMMSLPLHPALEIADVDRVCDTIIDALKRGNA